MRKEPNSIGSKPWRFRVVINTRVSSPSTWGAEEMIEGQIPVSINRYINKFTYTQGMHKLDFASFQAWNSETTREQEQPFGIDIVTLIIIIIIIITITITMILLDAMLTSNRSKKLISESSTPLKEGKKERSKTHQPHPKRLHSIPRRHIVMPTKKKSAPQASASHLLNSKQKRT